MSGTIAQLKELKELLDGGVLTQGEFDEQKSVILAGQAQSTMSGKPTGPRFDSSTGQPIPKFDTQTGKQNWWDEEGGQQLGLPPPPQPAIMMQPGMMQPVAGINAAGQMVDASGRTVVMDGGGRVWSAPYSKIMANVGSDSGLGSYDDHFARGGHVHRDRRLRLLGSLALVPNVSPHPKHEQLQGGMRRDPEVVEGYKGRNHGDRQLPYHLLHAQVLGNDRARHSKYLARLVVAAVA